MDKKIPDIVVETLIDPKNDKKYTYKLFWRKIKNIDVYSYILFADQSYRDSPYGMVNNSYSYSTTTILFDKDRGNDTLNKLYKKEKLSKKEFSQKYFDLLLKFGPEILKGD